MGGGQVSMGGDKGLMGGGAPPIPPTFGNPAPEQRHPNDDRWNAARSCQDYKVCFWGQKLFKQVILSKYVHWSKA